MMLLSILARAILGADDDFTSTILLLALVSTIIIPAHVINRRMDALAALLREDGILRDTPPRVKDRTPSD